MDGAVDIFDAQILLDEYCFCQCGGETHFTETQIELATIVGSPTKYPLSDKTVPFSLDDAQIILLYSTMKIAGIDNLSSVENWEEIIKVYKQFQEVFL